ncbi:DUF535 family protein [Vibrio artabrorum]|uniref:DUF535 family protein n=1 Tax=Vibrio artabrorum TaxID=446374 RepID=A0ABT8CLX5_9VIBR|nr:DUF535 family protein [Vibrio artabrorum]MDN3702692.1 DUF535 family protein [Vibrio artabrorum]
MKRSKRSLYTKRYALLDDLEADLISSLNSLIQ